MRLTTVAHSWYRLDRDPPGRWSWRAFPGPRYRFDSAAGSRRTRYAGQTPRVALRERFDELGRIVSVQDEQLRLVELTGRLRVLDLRRDVNLDALGLDDQVSTARAPDVWRACRRLADLVDGWFGERCHGIVYRSRTTPERSANLAFGRTAPLTARSLGRLGDLENLLVAAVLSDGFTIESWG